MAAEKMVPIEVWPLASHLAEEMEHRGWTAVDVAKRMPGDYAHNIGIINLVLAVQTDNMIIDHRTTEPIARAFGVSTEFFQNLHDQNCISIYMHAQGVSTYQPQTAFFLCQCYWRLTNRIIIYYDMHVRYP